MGCDEVYQTKPEFLPFMIGDKKLEKHFVLLTYFWNHNVH
jgi:hypothetical protein